MYDSVSVAGVTSQLFSIIWWCRPFQPYIFRMHNAHHPGWPPWPTDHIDHSNHTEQLDHFDQSLTTCCKGFFPKIFAKCAKYLLVTTVCKKIAWNGNLQNFHKKWSYCRGLWNGFYVRFKAENGGEQGALVGSHHGERVESVCWPVCYGSSFLEESWQDQHCVSLGTARSKQLVVECWMGRSSLPSARPSLQCVLQCEESWSTHWSEICGPLWPRSSPRNSAWRKLNSAPRSGEGLPKFAGSLLWTGFCLWALLSVLRPSSAAPPE